ncbi:unnamed protein product, partial [marine sediment metagenome]
FPDHLFKFGLRSVSDTLCAPESRIGHAVVTTLFFAALSLGL